MRVCSSIVRSHGATDVEVDQEFRSFCCVFLISYSLLNENQKKMNLLFDLRFNPLKTRVGTWSLVRSQEALSLAAFS